MQQRQVVADGGLTQAERFGEMAVAGLTHFGNEIEDAHPGGIGEGFEGRGGLSGVFGAEAGAEKGGTAFVGHTYILTDFDIYGNISTSIDRR